MTPTNGSGATSSQPKPSVSTDGVERSIEPLPSPTFIASPTPHQVKATSVIHTAGLTPSYPTAGPVDLSSQPQPAAPSALSAPPSRHGGAASSIFSPAYAPQGGSAGGVSPPSGFSLSASSSSPAAQRRRLEVLPSQWVNSDADYVPLIPITVIALLTLYVLYICLPTRSQFLDVFSSSPSTLTPFHLWASPHHLPPIPQPLTFCPESSCFLGRKQQLATLHSLLSTAHTATVTGRPGSGKTALLRRYIDEFAVSPSSSMSPPYNVVLHVSAASEEALLADYALLHATLQLPLLAHSAAAIRSSVISFLSQFARYLVVFDDCRLPASLLASYLPRRMGRDSEGLVADVVYVRDSSRRGEAGGTAGIVKVGGLSRSQAVLLLSAASGRDVANSTREQAESLVELLEKLPQALVLSGLLAREEGLDWPELAALVTEQLSSSSPFSAQPTSRLQAVVRAVLARPVFAESIPALSALSLLANESSSLPQLLVPASLPLSLYLRYGLMYADLHSLPYSYFHHLLFATTEQKTATVFVLKELMLQLHQLQVQQQPQPDSARNEELNRAWSVVQDSGMVEALVLTALGSFLHSPFHHNITLRLPAGAPGLPMRPFPPLPAISLSAFHLVRSPSASSSSLVQSVFGSSSALSAADYSFAQAAALLPPLLTLTRVLTPHFSGVSLRLASESDRITVHPHGLPPSTAASSSLIRLLLVLGCYVGDVQRDYDSSGHIFTVAAAVALSAAADSGETAASAVLLLAVNHLQRDDHIMAVSLLNYLHERFQLSFSSSPAPSSDSSATPLSVALQADILSALAVGYLRTAGTSDTTLALFTSAMSTREQLLDRSALLHLLTCRDLLLLHADPSDLSSSPAAQSACEHIESGVFPSPSYVAAGRQLSLALLQSHHSLLDAQTHFLSATAQLSSLSSTTPDPRLALALVQQIQALSSSSSPSSHPGPVLEQLFGVLSSSHPRGVGVYFLPLLQVATATLAGQGAWTQGMDVVRQGYEVVRGEGSDDEVWRRVYAWMYTQNEREIAEEKRREAERERLRLLKEKDDAEAAKQTEL